MVSKEKFIEAITFIKKQDDLQNNFCNSLEALAPGNYCNCFLYSDYENKLVDLLEISLGIDEKAEKCNTLRWWLYDCNFGKTVAEFTLDEKPYFLDTVEKLYDYLVEEHCIL